MKFAYMLNTPEVDTSRALGMLGDFVTGLDTLAQLGYEGVELNLRDPAQLDAEAIRSLAAERGLAVCAVCTGEIQPQDALSLADPRDFIREMAVDRMKSVIDFASVFPCNVNIGRFRGEFVDGVPISETQNWGLESFVRCADYAERHGVVLMLEPVARAYCNWINTTEEGICAMLKVNHAAFALMLDLAHMAAEDPTVAGGFLSAGSRVKHIHVCDDNRGVPGTGGIGFGAVFGSLNEIEYDGWLSAELMMEDHVQAAGETLAFLQDYDA